MATAAFATGTLLLTGRRRAIPFARASARASRCTTMSAPAAASPAAYEQMSALLREVSTLHAALGILGWDEQTMLPPGAADARARQKAALAGVAHEKASSPALGDAIAACEAGLEGIEDNFARANVRDARRSFDQTARVSKALAMEKEAAESEGYAAWAAARAANDWAGFAPTLVKGLDVFKRYAAATRPEMKSYDAAIDMFERGMTADRLSTVFDELAPPLKNLLDRVSAARATAPPVKKMLKGGDHWDIEAQARLCKKLAERLNFDFEKGRIDVSHHPFTGGAGPEDTRITTRYSTEVPWEGIMGTVHEVGHALYEQGRNAKHEGLPVSDALSMGSHESQSLFWERMVAQNTSFWKAVMPIVREELPFAADLSADDFAYAVNQVNPEGLIRVDADELSYPFHIILRFQIERGLFDGSMKLQDLPQIWNAKMKEYFGVDVPNDANGVLQDVHWGSGAWGYFPSYLLGSMTAAQLYAYMDKEGMPGMEGRIERGEFAEIKAYLNEKFHVLGSVHPSLDELLVAVTGEPLRAQYFLDYVEKKYSALYNLK